MTTRIKDKIILITGASSGIGEACAFECAAAGANLILVARRAERLEQIADHLRNDYKIKVLTITLDICDKSAVDQTFRDLPNEWTAIDVLINNAGMAFGRDPIQDSKFEDMEQVIDTNVKSLLHFTMQTLPGMLTRKQGHIVNIGSLAGHEVYAGGTVYCATKFAVGALSSGLKQDLLGTPIRVSLVSPGMVKTDFSRVRFHNDEKRAEQVYAGMEPLTAQDVAEAVVFCITRAPHVNISEILMLPTDQASTSMVNRKN